MCHGISNSGFRRHVLHVKFGELKSHRSAVCKSHPRDMNVSLRVADFLAPTSFAGENLTQARAAISSALSGVILILERSSKLNNECEVYLRCRRDLLRTAETRVSGLIEKLGHPNAFEHITQECSVVLSDGLVVRSARTLLRMDAIRKALCIQILCPPPCPELARMLSHPDVCFVDHVFGAYGTLAPVLEQLWACAISSALLRKAVAVTGSRSQASVPVPMASLSAAPLAFQGEARFRENIEKDRADQVLQAVTPPKPHSSSQAAMEHTERQYVHC